MSGIYEDNNRQVIPRWYPFSTANILGDLEPISSTDLHPKSDLKILDKKLLQWQSKKRISDAIDLVGTALILREYSKPDLINTAETILKRKDHISKFGKEIATAYLAGKNRGEIGGIGLDLHGDFHKQQIANLKRILKVYPRNAIVYADLAFYYTLLNQHEKAKRYMEIAIAIAPNNRFVLRSAARLFVHFDDPQKALHYLRSSELAKYDPWITSTEIAISERSKQKPHLIKAARAMLNNDELSSWSINELAATLSTLEAQHGARSKSKKLLSKALSNPNENTVAQAEWLLEKIGQDSLELGKEVIAPYEATARRAFREEDYSTALEFAEKWFYFQPFTSRPVVFASYIASTCFQNHNKSIKMIEDARLISPDSILLRNNYIFSLASIGRVQDAEKELSKIHNIDETNPYRNTVLATEGLLEFRKGNLEQGRKLYKEAIARFKKAQDNRAASIAAFYWAREEMSANTTYKEVALREADALISKNYAKELIEPLRSLKQLGVRIDTKK